MAPDCWRGSAAVAFPDPFEQMRPDDVGSGVATDQVGVAEVYAVLKHRNPGIVKLAAGFRLLDETKL